MMCTWPTRTQADRTNTAPTATAAFSRTSRELARSARVLAERRHAMRPDRLLPHPPRASPSAPRVTASKRRARPPRRWRQRLRPHRRPSATPRHDRRSLQSAVPRRGALAPSTPVDPLRSPPRGRGSRAIPKRRAARWRRPAAPSWSRRPSRSSASSPKPACRPASGWSRTCCRGCRSTETPPPQAALCASAWAARQTCAELRMGFCILAGTPSSHDPGQGRRGTQCGPEVWARWGESTVQVVALPLVARARQLTP
jgi:hypothetical protein